MMTYIAGAVIIILCIIAARSWCGKKYAKCGCGDCPHAAKCQKEKI